MISHFAGLTELDLAVFKEQVTKLEADIHDAYEKLYEDRNWQLLNAAGGLDEKILESIFIEEGLDHPFNRDKVKAIKTLAIDYLVCRWKVKVLKRRLDAEWKALNQDLANNDF